MLSFHDVVKHYAAGAEVVRAVDGVSLSVGAGEMVAIYGPSGSGKTTLLQLAAALLAPDDGTVTFNGRDLAGLTPNEGDDHRLRQVGFVFQDFQLMKGVPIEENAALKLLADRVSVKAARRAAVPWLRRVGLGHRLGAVPEQLSGGERQRVAIAAALVNEPRLILADEPTGSLDSATGRSILDLLRELARERRAAVLLVTHDPQAADVADRVHRLRDGKLVDHTAADPETPAGPARLAGAS